MPLWFLKKVRQDFVLVGALVVAYDFLLKKRKEKIEKLFTSKLLAANSAIELCAYDASVLLLHLIVEASFIFTLIAFLLLCTPDISSKMSASCLWWLLKPIIVYGTTDFSLALSWVTQPVGMGAIAELIFWPLQYCSEISFGFADFARYVPCPKLDDRALALRSPEIIQMANEVVDKHPWVLNIDGPSAISTILFLNSGPILTPA